MFQMLGVFAEFERSIIRDRVNAGLARANGVILGRPQTKANIENAIRATLNNGTGILKTAKIHGVGTSVVQRIKAAMV